MPFGHICAPTLAGRPNSTIKQTPIQIFLIQFMTRCPPFANASTLLKLPAASLGGFLKQKSREMA
ncbi:MAG: hypothetical protein A2V67_16170 [Deltaproteobacteria bacterium RBG_13_61_14]|nr:MAG: hypothetical protein A2V67_16170 [Deltaproteobacteria bacterium RBG_13_61_14]